MWAFFVYQRGLSGFFIETKVSSELVPIQEPASLVNKEGPHLPTGKYQISVVTQKKNTKI
jgi:hypothetical protein